MKLYDQLIIGLRSFFGMAEATESELHQAIADAGTIDQIKDKAKADAKAEFEATISDLSSKVDATAQSVTELQAEVASLRADLEAANDKVQAKEAELEASNGKVTQLSGELAKLKVDGAALKPTVKADGVVVEKQEHENKSAKVITGGDFMSMFK